MTTTDNLHTWKETTNEHDIVKEYTLDAGDGLAFKRSYYEYQGSTYSAEYNGVEIGGRLDGVFYEGDGYWYGFNSRSMYKYQFDKLIFKIESL